jgi:hypothetical protein
MPNNQYAYYKNDNGQFVIATKEENAERFKTKASAEICLKQLLIDQPELPAIVISVNPLH